MQATFDNDELLAATVDDPQPGQRLIPVRFRTPTVSVDVDVSLDEFGNTEIANYLRSCGYQVTGEPFNVFDVDALNHIETLSVCGQRDQAVFEALRLVGNAIGRPLQ